MSNELIDLNPFDLVIVEGEDSRKFLQGQLSCDMDDLTPENSLIGALCNIKGRVIADFRVVDYDGKCYLQLEPGMGDIVSEVLSKYIVFSKATIETKNDQFYRYGLLGDSAEELLSDLLGSAPIKSNQVLRSSEALVIRVSGTTPRFEIWLPHDGDLAADFHRALLRNTNTEPRSTWEIENLKNCIFHVDTASTELYLPETLNYDLSGIINFNKGCYTGQEVVARMYYRGKGKKRLFYGYGTITLRSDFTETTVSDNDGESHPVLAAVSADSGESHFLSILPAKKVEQQSTFTIGTIPVTVMPQANYP